MSGLKEHEAAWVRDYTKSKLGNGAHIAAAGGGHGATQSAAHAKQGAQPKVTYDGFYLLVGHIEALSRKEFQTKPPPTLMQSGDKAVDPVLQQLQSVVSTWHDPKNIPAAVRTFRAVEPRVGAILSDAQINLQIDMSQVGVVHRAMDAIADHLSLEDSDQQLEQAAAAKPTPELAFDIDSRELAKMEPGLRAWLDAVRAAGPNATPSAKKLQKRIETYFSKTDPSSRLAAFKAAGDVGDNGSLLDLIVLLTDNGSQAAVTMANTYLALAKAAQEGEKAGAKEALEAIEKWGKRVETAAKLGRYFFGALNIALSAKTLAEGISQGDWHKITAGTIGVAAGVAALAEGAGALATPAATASGAELAGSTAALGSAALNVGLIAIWGGIEATLMGAEVAHWFRQKLEQDAFLAMVKDARKLIPKGKKLAAAAEKMIDTDGDMDGVGAANNQRFKEIAFRLAGELRQEANKLIDRHLNTSSRSSVGGYPELIKPAKAIIQRGLTTMNTSDETGPNPLNVTDGYDKIVQGIKIMMIAEAASNDV